MSRPRLFSAIVYKCTDCPAWQDPPLSRFARSTCNHGGSRRMIDDPTKIADCCPLPEVEE